VDREFSNGGVLMYKLGDIFPRSAAPTALKPNGGLPTAGMAATMLLLPPVHVLLAIAAGGVVYAGAALLTGAVRRDDLRHLRRV
jgi:hypothetical protein